MKSQSENIKTNPDYLSSHEIERYLKGEMTEKEMYDTELKLENNGLNAAALEGYERNPDALNDLNRIRNRFNKTQNKKRFRLQKSAIYMSAAAIVFLLLSTYIIVNYYKSQIKTQVSDVVNQEEYRKFEMPADVNENISYSYSSEIVNIDAGSQLQTTPLIKDSEDVIIKSINIVEDEEAIDNSLSLDMEVDNKLPQKNLSADKIIAATEPSGNISNYEINSTIDEVTINENTHVALSSDKAYMVPASVNRMTVDKEVPEIATVSTKHFRKLKMIDYSNIYNSEIKIDKFVEEGGLNADYEKKSETKDVSVPEQITEYISYSDFLEESMTLFDKGRFEDAIRNFSIINREFPEELNAKYYSGLAYYELENYEQAIINLDYVIDYPVNVFNEDANWYKAHTLLNLNRTGEAKLLLQKIADENGSYSRKAKRKLRKLN